MSSKLLAGVVLANHIFDLVDEFRRVHDMAEGDKITVEMAEGAVEGFGDAIDRLDSLGESE